MNTQKNLIWLDLETTGLSPETDRILEIATLITDADLNIIAEGPALAVYQNQDTLLGMNDWCKKQHKESGLIAEIDGLLSHMNEHYAEQITLDFIKQYVPTGVSPMCGNSICFDRRFIIKYMPQLAQYFHYRNLDVSTVRELGLHWSPEAINDYTKKLAHRAMDDIHASVEELQFYRERLFVTWE